MRMRPRRCKVRRHQDDREAARGCQEPEGSQAPRRQDRLDEKRLLRWANIADKLRIKGMGKEYAGLLCAGRRRYREGAAIPQSRPSSPQAMAEANKKRKLVRFLPSEKLVTRWVENARKLPSEDHLLNAGSCSARQAGPLDTLAGTGAKRRS